MSLKLTINKVQPERKQITKRYNMLGACVHALARSLVRLTCPSLHDSKVCDRKKKLGSHSHRFFRLSLSSCH